MKQYMLSVHGTHGDPMPSRRLSRTTPRKATTMTAPSQSRCTTQPGSPTRSPATKKEPIGSR